MCGIFGVIRFDNQPVAESLFETMRSSLVHRGPDDYGHFLDGPVGIANLRLSIIDLHTGHQPIFNEDRSAVIAYNGEVYNFKELRAQLGNHVFTTQSDTEAILHAYDEWGRGCLPRLNGMFALSIWDVRRQTLLLARDRIGIKPLYYVRTPRYFAFASEIKALLHAGLVAPEVNAAALSTYLAVKYVPSEQTLFSGVRRLRPGEWLTVTLDGQVERGEFWTFGLNQDRSPRPMAEYAEELRGLVQQAVHDQLVSDVPVGAFLSGGLDSGIVVNEMARQMGRVTAYTIDYDVASEVQNERRYAELNALRAGAKHTTVICTSEQARDLLPLLVYHLDEPILEPLLAPSYLLARAARREVTVALTGEGADELFAGYDRYTLGHLVSRLRKVPGPVRRAGLQLATRLFGAQDVRARVLKLSLDSSFIVDWYVVFTDREIAALTNGTPQIEGWAAPYLEAGSTNGLLELFITIESCLRLPEYILTRADKMTMASSLEMRPPLLDNRIIDFALRVPSELKLNGKQGKYILRRAFENSVPPEVINQPKVAFSAPFERWLSQLCDTYLRDSHCARAGLLNQGEINRLLNNDPFYRGRHSEKLWALIILEVWFRVFVNRSLEPLAGA
mgnify:CR=1 FL=1